MSTLRTVSEQVVRDRLAALPAPRAPGGGVRQLRHPPRAGAHPRRCPPPLPGLLLNIQAGLAPAARFRHRDPVRRDRGCATTRRSSTSRCACPWCRACSVPPARPTPCSSTPRHRATEASSLGIEVNLLPAAIEEVIAGAGWSSPRSTPTCPSPWATPWSTSTASTSPSRSMPRSRPPCPTPRTRWRRHRRDRRPLRRRRRHRAARHRADPRRRRRCLRGAAVARRVVRDGERRRPRTSPAPAPSTPTGGSSPRSCSGRRSSTRGWTTTRPSSCDGPRWSTTRRRSPPSRPCCRSTRPSRSTWPTR